VNSVDTVVAVIDALNQLHADYMLVGSFSSNLYGIPRMTKDADFVLQVGQTPVAAITSILGAQFRLDPQVAFETITATTRYRIEHLPSRFTIEFFELSRDPHDQSRFSRRTTRTLAGRDVFVPTAEDVVITKLRWSKQGNRRKDFDDVEAVLSVQGNSLDLAYIRHWADLHGTRELFERLLASSAE
jgi:hypothetical protein